MPLPRGGANSESTFELLALAEHTEVAGFLRHVLWGGTDLNVRMDHKESWCEPAMVLLRRIPSPHHATCAPPLFPHKQHDLHGAISARAPLNHPNSPPHPYPSPQSSPITGAMPFS